jgi:hypothetical protein
MKHFVLCIAVLSSSAAHADALVDAISFAVTGSDASSVTAVNRAKCIFNVDGNTFYFDNIQTDRLKYRNMRSERRGNFTEIDLHGKQKVVDVLSKGATYDGSEFHRQLMQTAPGTFKDSVNSESDHTLFITTNESERLMSARQFIYSHGCVGQQSSF